MITKINRDDVFTIPASKFCISGTSSGYTLNYSADNVTWTPWENATDANYNQVVVGAPADLFFKLVGNTDDNVIIKY